MKKNYFYEIIFSRVALVIFVITIFLIAGLTKQPLLVEVVSDVHTKLLLPNGQIILAEVADTEKKRVEGLSGKDILQENLAMLFVFDDEDYRSFWMPDMQFAIDIIWLDEDYYIVGIAKNVMPTPDKSLDELPRYNSEMPAQYVLEVNAGFSERHNLIKGDHIESV